MTHVDKNFQDYTCQQLANDMYSWLRTIVIVHMFGCVINLQREIFDTKLGALGQIMRFLEVLLVGMYNFGMI
jgi:hypothetical protein